MILIIGAGLGGLSLARTLEKHNVPYRIFDQSPNTRFQGFGLTLHDHTISILMDMLQVDDATLRRLVSSNRDTSFMPSYICDPVSGEKHNNPDAAELPAAKERDFRTNRERLWAAVKGDLEIEYNHKLVDIQRREGSVIANFSNGESVMGTLLIAADGVHSSIRRTLLPHVVSEDERGVFFNGTRRIPKAKFERDFAPYMDGFAAKIGAYDNSLLGVTIYDTDPIDGAVYISWAYSRRRKEKDDPLFVPYAAGKEKLLAGPTPWEELQQLPPLAKPWSDIFQSNALRHDNLIRHQLVGHLVRTEDLITTLHDRNVVFIGDSARAYSNMAGTAGNEAIIDGVTLGNILVSGGRIERFYEQRYRAWENAIAFNSQLYEATHKPREVWLRQLK